MMMENAGVATMPQVVQLSDVISRWTPKDEALLQELWTRKDRIMTARKRDILGLVVKELGPILNETVKPDLIVEFLLQNADAVTKVVAPFTSEEVGK